MPADAASPLARLRAATHTRHERFDASPWLGAALRDLGAYAAHLAALAALYADAERALAPYAGGFAAAGYALAERRKAPALAAERAALAARGFSAHASSGAFPVIADVAAAWGCVYVLEGSTLGGVMIAQRVRTELAWEPQFYGIYGARTMPMWRAFTAALERLTDRLAAPALEQAATAVFDTYAERIAGLGPLGAVHA